MRPSLDKFILYFPVLFLKQYPYAWIAVVALWGWPPVFSGIFLLVIVIGLLALRWRAEAWISNLRREHAPGGENFYIDRLPVPVEQSARKIAPLLAVSGLVAWLMQDQFGLNFWQFFLMFVGFALFYMDGRFFGAVTIYIVTAGGIAIYFVPGHLDYRIFIRFKEIRQVARLEELEKLRDSWTVCSRFRTVTRGLLLVPRNSYGFSKRLQEILLTPTDTDAFLKHIPSTLLTDEL